MKEIVGGEEMFVNERAPTKPVLPTWGQTLGSQTLMARQRDALSELELDLELGPTIRASRYIANPCFTTRETSSREEER